ncbi:uncharacterized protein [Macrobrachium rosenbergii]|uniref:uncharacterized protein n=1 Tax=Macrobrachium rosenbergii TaxID=79674 RepID=UPI0034D709E7
MTTSAPSSDNLCLDTARKPSSVITLEPYAPAWSKDKLKCEIGPGGMIFAPQVKKYSEEKLVEELKDQEAAPIVSGASASSEADIPGTPTPLEAVPDVTGSSASFEVSLSVTGACVSLEPTPTMTSAPDASEDAPIVSDTPTSPQATPTVSNAPEFEISLMKMLSKVPNTHDTREALSSIASSSSMETEPSSTLKWKATTNSQSPSRKKAGARQ